MYVRAPAGPAGEIQALVSDNYSGTARDDGNPGPVRAAGRFVKNGHLYARDICVLIRVKGGPQAYWWSGEAFPDVDHQAGAPEHWSRTLNSADIKQGARAASARARAPGAAGPEKPLHNRMAGIAAVRPRGPGPRPEYGCDHNCVLNSVLEPPTFSGLRNVLGCPW